MRLPHGGPALGNPAGPLVSASHLVLGLDRGEEGNEHDSATYYTVRLWPHLVNFLCLWFLTSNIKAIIELL